MRWAAAALALIACAVALLVWAPWSGDDDEPELPVEGLPAPFAAGDSAANMTLSGSDAWVLVRWVARASGTLAALHLRIQADGSRCRQSGKTGYGMGGGGRWRVTTHSVRPDGLPDTDEELSAYEFQPCSAPRSVVDLLAGVVREPVDVKAGQRVSVSARDLTLAEVAADTAWGRLLGMHTPAAPWRVEGESDFSRAAPVYPLPAPPAAIAVKPPDV